MYLPQIDVLMLITKKTGKETTKATHVRIAARTDVRTP